MDGRKRERGERGDKAKEGSERIRVGIRQKQRTEPNPQSLCLPLSPTFPSSLLLLCLERGREDCISAETGRIRRGR